MSKPPVARQKRPLSLRLLAGLTGACLAAACLASRAALAAPPPAVTVTPAATQNIAPGFSNIGHVTAIQSVNIVPRVTAFINAVDFKQGSEVAAGTVLFTLQPEQYEAALQTAQANLASAQAAYDNAEQAYERALKLNKHGFEAQSNLDAALATRNEDHANILSAEASVATAKLNLSYCTIKAPIAGRIGAVTLTKGNLVTPSSGTLVTINQMDPIRVVFAVSSDSPILTGARGSPPGTAYTVNVDLPNGNLYSHPGTITFIDNHVDSTTGTVNVYADFPNPEGLLLPGAYVNVHTIPATPREALLVPIAAVQTDQQGSFVLVVGKDNKVARHDVTLGQQIGENDVVQKGLQQGDRVIVDGIQKVKPGETVKATTSNEAAAAPAAAASDQNQ